MKFLLDLSKYKCAIFDCDGVILQSNKIKSNAFQEALDGEPEELVEQFVLYHKTNGGVSRYVKFEYYFRNINPQEDYKLAVNNALIRYKNMVVDQLLVAEYVPGVINTINHLNDLNIPCFVVSGGDQNELCDIFKQRSIYDNFVEVYGSPVTKKQHVFSMQATGQIQFPGVFFGDSRSDMDAAKYIDLDFVFISDFSEWEAGFDVVVKNNMSTFKDFSELLEFQL